MSKEIGTIFDECIQRMASGEQLTECIQRYPQYVEELTPLLETASITRNVALSISCSPQAKLKGLKRLTTVLVNNRAKKQAEENSWFTLFGWPRITAKPVMLVLVAALTTAIMVLGTGAASSNSIPGEPLYWVKSQTENVSLIMPQSDISRAQTHVRLANERVHEIKQLVNNGNLNIAEQHIKTVRKHLGASAVYINIPTVNNPIEMPVNHTSQRNYAGSVELRANLVKDMAEFSSQFEDIIKKAPSRKKTKIDMLLHNSELHYVSLISALDGKPLPTHQPFSRFETPRPRRY